MFEYEVLHFDRKSHPTGPWGDDTYVCGSMSHTPVGIDGSAILFASDYFISFDCDDQGVNGDECRRLSTHNLIFSPREYDPPGKHYFGIEAASVDVWADSERLSSDEGKLKAYINLEAEIIGC